jgi:dienelactone hydrolase
MNRRSAIGLMATALLCTDVVLSASTATAQQNSLNEQLVRPEIVKVSLRVDGNPTDVVTHIYKPITPGITTFPVVIYSHGRPFNPNPPNTVDLTTPIMPEVANWWLQKGFAVVAPVRPGYGATGGADREYPNVVWQSNSCIKEPTFERSVLKSREVVLAVLAWAQEQPWVVRGRSLLVGQSAGGFATIATAATNPEGVVAGINFAGGLGGSPTESPRKSCKPEQVNAIYGQFGKTARMPTLWLYAENDLFWGVDVPRQWFEAFKTGGSDATLVQTPPVPGEENGHGLINTGGPLWKPSVEAFLQKFKF